jgi:L-ascorbate metabolism protein UlaG (beta-lactamase superfamily)
MSRTDRLDLSLPETTGEPPAAADIGELLFIGNATVLLRCGPFRILTDPNFLHQGDHAHLGYGLRSKRLKEPALDIDELPPIDFVVLSHHHGDHFDQRTAELLDKEIPIVSNEHAVRKLRKQGFREARSLDTWESLRVSRGRATVDVTAVPGRHAPGPLQQLLPPVMGSVLDFDLTADVPTDRPATSRIYITGDTLLHEALREIPRRYPAIDLALVHLGGTRILGVQLTMDGHDGVELLRIVQPRQAVPIHYGEYGVQRDPIDTFRAAIEAADLSTDVHFVERGETFAFR